MELLPYKQAVRAVTVAGAKDRDRSGSEHKILCFASLERHANAGVTQWYAGEVGQALDRQGAGGIQQLNDALDELICAVSGKRKVRR
jgi:hypothetical protein